MIARVRNHRRADRAATAIEYGIIAALIIVAAIGILTTTGNRLDGVFDTIANTISSPLKPSSSYPGGLPYQGLGIAPPTGPVTYTTKTVNGFRISGYAYANGTFFYSAIDPYTINSGENNYIAYKDGFVLKPGGQAPNGGLTTYSTFVSGCQNGGATGVDEMANSYTTGGTVSIASNGDWVCSGVQALPNGSYSWIYASVQ